MLPAPKPLGSPRLCVVWFGVTGPRFGRPHDRDGPCPAVGCLMLRRFLAWIRASSPSRADVLEAWARDSLTGYGSDPWAIW